MLIESEFAGDYSMMQAEALQQAINLHASGRLNEAEDLYRRILVGAPMEPDANHNLGVLLLQLGRPDEAAPMLKLALEAKPDEEQRWLLYLESLLRQEAFDAARAVLAQGRQLGWRGPTPDGFDRRLETKPAQAEVAIIADLFATSRYEELAAFARGLTERNPREGYGWRLLGRALFQTGMNQEAMIAARRSVELAPDDPEAIYLLGRLHHASSAFPEAEACYLKALAQRPRAAELYNDLGGLLLQQGRLDEAEQCFEQAVQIQPRADRAWVRLAWTRISQGKFPAALTAARAALEIVDATDARSAFVACVKRLVWTERDPWAEATLVSALMAPWGRPNELVQVSLNLIKLDPPIGDCIRRANAAWPALLTVDDLFGAEGLASLAGNPLVSALLTSTASCGVEMERFLTQARRALLNRVAAQPSGAEISAAEAAFLSILARQCFINEYVFRQVPDETATAVTVRDRLAGALDQGAPAIADLAVTATYFPLHSLPNADRFLERSWPAAVDAILVQQVAEPLEERRMRDDIPQLTEIDDPISRLVRQQYEKNPYPRWVRTARVGDPQRINDFFAGKFPLAPFDWKEDQENVDILIAGCGTGQHPLQTVGQFIGAKALAVDLSLSSLCYARRKTRELGVDTIEYAQADLLRLGALERRFDVIEALGVLHHLSDPGSGWPVLLSLLRPGGFMKIGLYSTIARRRLAKVKALIEEKGYRGTADDIRRCRQDMIERDGDPDFANFQALVDFYSTSECRDLLFHVQENCMTMASIAGFVTANDLRFLGFEVDHHVVHAYRQRFGNDPAAIDLDQWAIYENENPDTFIGMYSFWVQKKRG